MKRRVNFTVDEKLFEAAKYVATARGRSLSDMVEYHLRRMVKHMARHGEKSELIPEEHWLDRFHQEHLPEALRPDNRYMTPKGRRRMRRNSA